MNILCLYKEYWDEKTFYMAGIKKTDLHCSKMILYITFVCIFYTGHTKCLFDANFFCTDRHFSYEHPKLLFEFFRHFETR